MISFLEYSKKYLNRSIPHEKAPEPILDQDALIDGNINGIDELYFKNKLVNKICFITDSNGIIKFINPAFLVLINKTDRDACKGKCILDWIYKEDLFITIEYIVQLIQEKSKSIKFESRFKFFETMFLNLKWKSIYSRELIYFTITETPLLFTPSEYKKNPTAISPETSVNDLWKLDIQNTLMQWDKAVNVSINYCLKIK